MALLYGGAVMTAGILFVMAIVPQPMRTAMRTQAGLPSLVWLSLYGARWRGSELACTRADRALYAWLVWGSVF